MKAHRRRHLFTAARSWTISLATALLLATSFKSAVADWYVVPTGSMNPTIVAGDRIFTDKLAYDLKLPYTTVPLASWGAPARGDIVVFRSPADGQRLVKRVIGLPGETIAMRDNVIRIDGRRLAYLPRGDTGTAGRIRLEEELPGARHPVLWTPAIPAARDFGPVTVPRNRYLVLGDNRDNSADSRFFGFVERRRILGRATMVVISLDAADRYRPRWQRFFTALR